MFTLLLLKNEDDVKWLIENNFFVYETIILIFTIPLLFMLVNLLIKNYTILRQLIATCMRTLSLLMLLLNAFYRNLVVTLNTTASAGNRKRRVRDYYYHYYGNQRLCLSKSMEASKVTASLKKFKCTYFDSVILTP